MGPRESVEKNNIAFLILKERTHSDYDIDILEKKSIWTLNIPSEPPWAPLKPRADMQITLSHFLSNKSTIIFPVFCQ